MSCRVTLSCLRMILFVVILAEHDETFAEGDVILGEKVDEGALSQLTRL